MRLRITRIQEFRNSPTDPPVYEITGDIPSGFGRPVISGEYDLVQIGAAARAAGEPQDIARPAPAAAPSRNTTTTNTALADDGVGPQNVTAARSLGSQGQNRSGVGTRAGASPQNGSPNPKPRPGAMTRILGKESSELLCCHPTKVAEATKGGPHIVVQFYSAHPTGSGHTEAAEHFIACWEEKLFPAIKATVHQEAEFYVDRRTKNGREYVNIVGVRQKAEGARAG